MTPMKWFFSFLKKYRGLMIIGILLTTAVSVLSVVNPYISGQIVDPVSYTHLDVYKRQGIFLPRMLAKTI